MNNHDYHICNIIIFNVHSSFLFFNTLFCVSRSIFNHRNFSCVEFQGFYLWCLNLFDFYERFPVFFRILYGGYFIIGGFGIISGAYPNELIVNSQYESGIQINLNAYFDIFNYFICPSSFYVLD